MRVKYAIAFAIGNFLGFLLGLYDRSVALVYALMKWRDWKCHGYRVTGQGGTSGGTYTLRRMTRQQAETFVARNLGTVVSVQEADSLIFFRSKE